MFWAFLIFKKVSFIHPFIFFSHFFLQFFPFVGWLVELGMID